jgi:hypothetical protein
MNKSMRFTLLIGILFVLTPLTAQGDWVLQKDKDGIQVYTKEMPGSNFKAFRGVTILECSMESIISVFMDAAACVDWMQNCKSSRFLENNGTLKTLTYIQTEAPWPVKDRDGIYPCKQ